MTNKEKLAQKRAQRRGNATPTPTPQAKKGSSWDAFLKKVYANIEKKINQNEPQNIEPTKETPPVPKPDVKTMVFNLTKYF